MLRGIYGDPGALRQAVLSQIPGMYFTGDGAKRDKEGYLCCSARIDDVMNISGHRVSRWRWNGAGRPSVRRARPPSSGAQHEIKARPSRVRDDQAGRPQTEELKKEIRSSRQEDRRAGGAPTM